MTNALKVALLFAAMVGCDRVTTCTIYDDCLHLAGHWLCVQGVCQQHPTCSDGLRNLDETDVDCGGSCFPHCTIGKKCLVQSDCGENGDCVGGVCTARPCTVQTDCRGLFPRIWSLCDSNGTCLPDSMTLWDACLNGVCTPPTCSDGVQDGLETDVDCGEVIYGSCGFINGRWGWCAPGKKCRTFNDCQDKGLCLGGICQVAICTDMFKNGTETDVDCGGGNCPGCAQGGRCEAHSDCGFG